MLYIYKFSGRGATSSIKVGDVIQNTKWGAVVVVGINFITLKPYKHGHRLSGQALVQVQDGAKPGSEYNQFDKMTFTYRDRPGVEKQLPYVGKYIYFKDEDTNEDVDGAVMQVRNLMEISNVDHMITVRIKTEVIAERSRDWINEQFKRRRSALFHVVANNADIEFTEEQPAKSNATDSKKAQK
ncbi:hypothetical protein [Lactiplantibacillus plantarum]|uniref:hypothetical protein n=1 Tax=Lactiplantibacillus plantarum TaxID=1590 RepID=UPI001BA51143|nr:hypothetical protein [Lactiplantibacillus plantarum]MBS0936609.1 hypothetical protein [Lactiplantibacillus plantarum]MBS0943810.1 hypothetical protein [Lactiplantibacillus plantarum]